MRIPSPESKELLIPEEAIAFYGFSSRKFRALINRSKELPFICMHGNRKFIVKKQFEAYLEDNPGVKEELRNGEPKKKRL